MFEPREMTGLYSEITSLHTHIDANGNPEYTVGYHGFHKEKIKGIGAYQFDVMRVPRDAKRTYS